MNRENLNKMADLADTIPQEMFNMGGYRLTGSDWTSHKCNSVGCLIGHATVLDDGPLPLDRFGIIDFTQWSQAFTGLRKMAWEWCFSGSWEDCDNTPRGAGRRIRYLLKHGEPPYMWAFNESTVALYNTPKYDREETE